MPIPGLKRAGHAQSAVHAITLRPTPYGQLRRVSFTNPFTNPPVELGKVRPLKPARSGSVIRQVQRSTIWQSTESDEPIPNCLLVRREREALSDLRLPGRIQTNDQAVTVGGPRNTSERHQSTASDGGTPGCADPPTATAASVR